MILEPKKRARPLHAPRYRQDTFRQLTTSPQMRAVVARCTTSKPKPGGAR